MPEFRQLAIALIAALYACSGGGSGDEADSRSADAGARASAARDGGPANDATPGARDAGIEADEGAADGGSDAGGVAGSGANAVAGHGGTGPTNGGPPAHPVSEYCGDAIRDPVLEECDDGPGADDDVCSDDCRVRSVALFPLEGEDELDAGASDQPERTLGTGPHVASGHEHGFAAVYAQTEGAVETSVWLQAHDERGGRNGSPVEVSAGSAPIDAANPVIAALPGDRYAIVWTDVASGTPDVLVRLWNASNGELGEARPAHDATGGFQQDADLLWTGEQLIVAFTDLLDVRYRAFDANLRPLGPSRALAASATAIESSVSLARFGSGWAAALRANEDAFERIDVIAGSLSWSTPPAPPGPSGDRPALVALDAEHLLLLFNVGTDPLATGQPSVGRLRVAVLSVAAPGQVSTSAFTPLLEPYASDDTLAQRRPSAARVGERVYVAWETASTPGDARGRQAFVAQLHFDPASEILTQGEERPLALDVAREGDQLNPRVAAGELFPEGALISVWEDVPSDRDPGPGANPEFSAEIALDFRPSPFVVLEP
jgi:cysteine-rich repeat protein